MDMTERVARAICRTDIRGANPDDSDFALAIAVNARWFGYIPAACAAISAMRQPTLEMRVAANDAEAEAEGPVGYGTLWQAMIDAALGEP